MSRRVHSIILQALLFTLICARPVAAQPQTGSLRGTVVDEQGLPLPGVTVTLQGGGAPAVQVTNAQGEFQFLSLTPGSYSIEAEIEGFSTIKYPNVVINAGRNTQIEVTLTPTTDDVITVLTETPLLDDRRISTGTTVSQTELEKIPTSRDPWTILQTTPGVLGDRINVGCGDDDPLVHLPTEANTDYAAKAVFPTPNGWGLGWVSTINQHSSFHLGSVSKHCLLNPNSYVRSGGNLEVVDVGERFLPFSNSPFRYAGFFVRDTAQGTDIKALPFNVNSTGKYAFGAETTLGNTAVGRFNFFPRGEFDPASGKFFVAFTVCETANLTGCQDLRTAVLDPKTLGVLAGSSLLLHVNPPYQFVPRGTDVKVGPNGDVFVAYTLNGGGGLSMGGWTYDAFGHADPAGVTDLFPTLPGIQFGGVDSVQAGSDFWAITGQVYSSNAFTSWVTTVPLEGPRTPSAPVRVGTTSSSQETNAQLHPNWKLYSITDSTAQQPVVAAAVAGPGTFEQQLKIRQACHPSETILCLGGGRFEVQVTDVSNNVIGAGTAYFLTNDTGYFTFFNAANVELLVKVIDGCGLGGHFWVFAGGLTDVKTLVTVTDTTTGQRVTIANPQGTPFKPYQNTAAFACTDFDAPSALAGAPAVAPRSAALADIAPLSEAAVNCQADATHLCLNNGRFRVSTEWKTQQGATGQGQAVALPGGGGAPDTGYFWFFAETNVEMIVKVLAGCPLNHRYWVFAGGLTNVEVTTTVRDTANGTVKTYKNPQGKAFQPVQDTGAFATCP